MSPLASNESMADTETAFELMVAMACPNARGVGNMLCDPRPSPCVMNLHATSLYQGVRRPPHRLRKATERREVMAPRTHLVSLTAKDGEDASFQFLQRLPPAKGEQLQCQAGIFNEQ